MSDSWTTIESDPGVFTELCHRFDAGGVELQELYSLDPDSFERLEKPVYGLVFLFKWQREADDRPTVADGEVPGLFFAKQVINDACATQALINVLMNVEDEGFELGETLTEFKTFTSEFPAELKGAALGDSTAIRTAHNSFARAEPLIFEGPRPATDDDDVFHFIAYIPYRGQVYELDGLKAGPIALGEYDSAVPESWVGVAAPAVQTRIARYAASEVRFNLLAMVRNSVQALEARVAAAQATGDAATIEGLQLQLAEAQARHAGWKEENVRRRHNYLPLAIELVTLNPK